jgi:probable HAF family extracellular repeat protein
MEKRVKTPLRSLLPLSLAAVIVASWVVPVHNQANGIYSIVDLATPSGLNGRATAINDSGQVVGIYGSLGGTLHAFRWQNGVLVEIAAGPSTLAHGINAAGQVVGVWSGSGYPLRAFRWDNGVTTQLSGLLIGRGIDSNGRVVGTAAGQYGGVAAVWEAGSTAHLHFPAAPDGGGDARDINAGGTIVGGAAIGNFFHAFRFQNGTMTDLGTVGDDEQSYAFAINDAGDIAGQSINGLGGLQVRSDWAGNSGFVGYVASRAIVWRNGAILDLGALGGTDAAAFGINNAGDVVGSAQVSTAVNRIWHAFIYRNGVMIDLNTLLPSQSGWTLNTAYGINDTGQIVGEGTYNGQIRPFLLTPDAPPASAMPTTTTLTVTENAGIFGLQLNLTASVTAAAGTPAGSVRFFVDGVAIGTSALAGGIAPFQTPTLVPGTHVLSALFERSTEFDYSSSTPVVHTVRYVTSSSGLTAQQTLLSAPTVSINGGSLSFRHAFDPATNRLYVVRVTYPDPGQVDVISTTQNTVEKTWSPSAANLTGYPTDVAVDLGRRRLYVFATPTGSWSSYNGVIWVLDADTFTHIDTIDVGALVLPSQTFPVLNPTTGELFFNAFVSGNPYGLVLMAVDPSLPSSTVGRVHQFDVVGSGLFSPVVNGATNLLYLPGFADGSNGPIRVIDVHPGSPTYGLQVDTIAAAGPLALDYQNQRLYASAAPDAYAVASTVYGIHVIDVNRSRPTFHTLLTTIPVTHQQNPVAFPVAFALNSGRSLLYTLMSDYSEVMGTSGNGTGSITAIELDSSSVASVWPVSAKTLSHLHMGWPKLFLNTLTDSIYAAGALRIDEFRDPRPTSVDTPADAVAAPFTTRIGPATLTFSDITSGGSTSSAPITPESLDLTQPGNFSIANTTAFEIFTTAQFTGPITLCFNMSSVYDPDAFAALGILHGEAGAWVDRTVSRDFATGQLCARVTSLSPFVIARLSAEYQVQSLHDSTKAFKAGATVPIKVRLLGPSGANVSSALLTVNAKRLTRISSNTASTLQDAGQANADRNFRYDAALGGYVYNLKTTGLQAGTYELAFRAAGDVNGHSVTFQVR